ncbi:MAG TPA: hypothetical protein VF444_18390 [Pseudonocardiaceae bacterium]
MGLPLSDETMLLLAVLFLLSGVLRRVFGTQTSRAERKLARARDYGLLREIATVPSPRSATFVQERLRQRGIRSTVAPSERDDRLGVLVFPADARTAADALLADSTEPDA